MKKIALAVVALLLLGGGGAAAWLYMNGRLPVARAPQQVADTLPVYVEFNPIVVPVIGARSVEQTVVVAIALEVADDATADRVIALAPRLNDAFLTALYGQVYSRDVLASGMLDVLALKRRLMAAADRVMGPGVVRDALIQNVSQRPA